MERLQAKLESGSTINNDVNERWSLVSQSPPLGLTLLLIAQLLKSNEHEHDRIGLFLVPTPTPREYYALGNMYSRTIECMATIKWKNHAPTDFIAKYRVPKAGE
jgi:hypothetical protein